MEQIGNAYTIFVGKLEGRRFLNDLGINGIILRSGLRL
jgi:hypothetical protein